MTRAVTLIISPGTVEAIGRPGQALPMSGGESPFSKLNTALGQQPIPDNLAGIVESFQHHPMWAKLTPSLVGLARAISSGTVADDLTVDPLLRGTIEGMAGSGLYPELTKAAMTVFGMVDAR